MMIESCASFDKQGVSLFAKWRNQNETD